MSVVPPTIGIDVGGSSVKAAMLVAGRPSVTAQSDRYDAPTFEELRGAVKTAITRLGPEAQGVTRAGLCIPGVRDCEGLTIVESVNLPAVVGVRIDVLLRDACGRAMNLAAVVSDVHAAAVDIHACRPEPGRLLVIAMGTGVGACVLDNGKLFTVAGASSGHVGQMDVSLDIPGEEPPLGRDGGRGSLEAYVGLPALEARYGRHLEHVVAVLDETSPPLLALARAVRICHAIYRPDCVTLAGGVGAMLAGKLELLRSMIGRDLTRLARPSWRLEAASNVFHAAVGAARVAAAA